jgi:putative FmdB family regulatory protein
VRKSGEELAMPTYSYRCEECQKTFSRQMTIADHDKAKVKCPECGSRKVRQHYEAFSVKTSKKS